MNNSKLLLILVVSALLVRFIAFTAFSDSFYNTARLLPQFSVAHNIVEGNGVSIDQEFVNAAGKFINEKQRLVDFNELLSKFSTGKLNANPEITDTWGMAYLTAFFWKLTNSRSYFPIQLLQMVIDSLTILPIFWLSILLFTRKEIAQIATISYVIFPSFLFLSTTLNRDYYSAWGIIWSTYFFVAWMKNGENQWWRLLVSIVLLSISLWFRPTILFVPGIWAIYYLTLNKSLRGLKTIIPIFVLMMGVEFLLFILPFALQYNAKYSEYNFSSGLNGGAFWAGLGEFDNKYHFVCNDDSAKSRAVQLGYPKDGVLYTPEFSRILKEDAMNIVRQDPMFFVEVIVKRYTYFFFARPPFGVSERSNIHFARMNLPIGDFIRQYPFETIELVVKALFAVLLPLCSLLLLWLRRNEWKPILLLLLLWQYPLIVHLPTHLENRYVVPHLFALIIATSCFGYYLYRKLVHHIPFKQP